jgi:hypothetical protein
VVTMGRRASDVAREWFAADRYQDYLYLHGLSVEMAEAFAEYVHKRIRGELGFAAEEARDHDEMLAQGYRGSRYAFGHPPPAAEGPGADPGHARGGPHWHLAAGRVLVACQTIDSAIVVLDIRAILLGPTVAPHARRQH